jgi:hypothetical protein
MIRALLARAFPGRGRHRRGGLLEDTVTLPRVTDDDEKFDENTRLDLDRARPYVDRGDDNPWRFLP